MRAIVLLVSVSWAWADGSPGPRIVGRVTDDAGEPVPAARLAAQTAVAPFLWAHVPAQTQSEDDGRFVLPVPLAGVRYHVRAEKPGHGEWTGTVLVEAEAEVSPRLGRRPVVTLSGIVREAETGTPVAGAAVEVAGEYGFRGAAETGETGRFEVAGVPELGQGVVVARKGNLVTPLAVERGKSPADLALVPAAGLRGIVREQDSGRPIAGAAVTLRPVFCSGFGLAATSGDDGRFEFAGIPPGEYLVEARHPTFYDPRLNEGHRGRVEIPLRSDAAAFWPAELRKTATVKGRVLGPTDQPAAGVLVGMKMVGETYGGQAEWQVTRTDTAGGFTLRTGRVNSKETIEAFSSEHGSGRVEVEPLTEGEVREGVTIRLSGMMRIRGAVTDRSVGPVRDVRVQADWNEGARDTTASDGRFDLGRVPLRPPPTAACEVRFEAPRPYRGGGNGGQPTSMPAAGAHFFHPHRVAVSHDPGREVDLAVSLDEAEVVTLAGRVVSHEGVPVVGAQVTLYPGHLGEKAWERQRNPTWYGGDSIVPYVPALAWTMTDKAGRWALPVVRESAERLRAAGLGPRGDPAQFSVSAVGPGGAFALVNDIVLKPDEARKDIEVRLGAPEVLGQLKGVVVDLNGGVVAGAELVAQDPATQVMTGPDGRFTIAYRREEFQVRVELAGWSVVAPAPSPDGRHFTVRPPGDAEAAVRVVLARSGAVAGAVRWQSGRPVTAFTLSGPLGSESVVSAGGRFEMTDLPPGQRTVGVQTPDGMVGRVKVNVLPAAVVPAEIVLPDPAYRVRAVACDEKGLPVTGVPLLLTGKWYWAKGLPDEQGRVEFAVPPGEYELSARREREELTTRIDLPARESAGGLVEAEVPFPMPRSGVGALRIQVVNREGRPLAGIRIDGPRGTFVTDAAGRCEMRGLPVGRRELEVTSQTVLKNEHMRIPVNIEGGKTTAHTVRLGEGFRIAGRVMCAGQPAGNVHLWLAGQEGSERKSFAHSLPDGSFQFINLPARVTIRATPYQSNLPVTKSFDLQGDLAEATIDLPTGRIEGQALDRRGQPWAGAMVRVTYLDAGEEGRQRQVHRESEAGRINLIYLPDGRYRLDLMDPWSRFAAEKILDTREVAVRSGEALEGIILREKGGPP